MSRAGPIDDFPAVDVYAARVITPSGERVHGYHVEEDLIENYSFAELLSTMLTGTPPSEADGTALSVLFSYASTVLPGAVPCHAAGLSRLMGARSTAVLATACLALAEQARELVEAHGELLAWLDTRQGAAPQTGVPTDADRESVARLQRRLQAVGVESDIFSFGLTRTATIFALLHQCGIKRAEHLQTIMVMCRLAPVMAEALAVTPLAFSTYPLKLPHFQYTGDGDA